MKVNDEVFQWKMSFNPDASKQAEEIIISLKLSKASHPTLFFTKHHREDRQIEITCNFKSHDIYNQLKIN